MDKNEDFRTWVLTTVLSAKFAAYADRYYEDMAGDEDKTERTVKFWEGLNDYYAALTSNLASRLFVGPLVDTHQYLQYVDEH